MKKLFAIAVMLLFAVPAHAEMSANAKANAQGASIYAQMDAPTQVAYAVGIVVGMRTIFDIMGGDQRMEPPESEDVYALLNYCYVAGNCRHVSPGAIALAAYQKPSVAHNALKQMELDAKQGK